MQNPHNHLFPEATTGLIFIGGKSSRMGQDKSLLNYHGQPQRDHLWELLSSFCENLYLSGRLEHAIGLKPGLPLITDDAAWGQIGPMAGLLTAFEKFPGRHMLVIGCDYPFLDKTALQALASCSQSGRPTAFFQPETVYYEPLLAWYPAQAFEKIKEQWKAGSYGLQQFLRASNAIQCIAPNPQVLQSIDTREDYVKALKHIQG